MSGRVVSILEGESLLNDATALVLLRTAVVGAATSVTLGGVLGDFAFAVAVAVAIGFVVGKLNLWVRERVADATVNTVLSFTVPFLASLPAEALGASGLVAAVVAGLVTGHGAYAPRKHTVQVQPGGTVTFDVTTDAVGDWAFHCHMLYHMHAGMMQIVSVRPREGTAA